MIKKIQLRGLSRTPSDRQTADGGCAESLNVQLNADEIAPMPKPVGSKDAAGNTISVDGDILFIHKGIGYENLIYRDGRTLYWIATLGASGSGTVYDQLQEEDSEQINDITAVGNTLVVSTTVDMYYILRKEDGYHFLGSQIPTPSIHFRMDNLARLRSIPDVDNSNWEESFGRLFDLSTDFKVEGVEESESVPVFAHESVGDTESFGHSATKYVFDASEHGGFWIRFLNYVWSKIDKLLNEQRGVGRAVFPVFVRYAVRLYDGTIYAQSIPILIGADVERFLDVKGGVQQWYTLDSKPYRTVIFTRELLASAYSLVLNASGQSAIFDGWDDIINGVDIFVSPQMMPVQRNAARFKTRCFRIFGSDATTGGAAYFLLDDFSIDPFYTEDRQEDLLRSYQETFLAKHYSIDEFRALSGDVVLDDINFSSDYLYLQEPLKETSQSMHHVSGKRMFNYNKRLLLTDATQELYHGYPFLHSVKWDDMEQNPIRFVYHLRGENGEAQVICRDESGNKQITPRSAAVVENLSILYHEVPVAWLAYPDSRCYQVDVYHLGRQASVASYKMKAMPQADVAYAFIGFGKPILQTATFTPDVPEDEDATFEMPNSILVSKFSNPFVFPGTDAISFTAGEILNLAVITHPLSQGQVGQFKLYVFTDEGVYALSPDSEGNLRTIDIVSRDILSNPDALVAIEQGIFFSSARGLLLLQGMQITKVSEYMEGPPFNLSEDLSALIEDRHMNGLSIERQESFYKFLPACKMAYDYANSRIVLFREGGNVQYEYKFDTQTWHRLNMGIGSYVRVLNSFPEALVVTKDGGRQSIYNLSVPLDSEGVQVLPGLIVTRPLDLGEPDVRKAIRSIRIRGNFNRYDVQYILEGSFDGIHWKQLHSLRGGSYKQFRLSLLTNLSPTERISWIDIDYEPRFANKLR